MTLVPIARKMIFFYFSFTSKDETTHLKSNRTTREVKKVVSRFFFCPNISTKIVQTFHIFWNSLKKKTLQTSVDNVERKKNYLSDMLSCLCPFKALKCHHVLLFFKGMLKPKKRILMPEILKAKQILYHFYFCLNMKIVKMVVMIFSWVW